MVCPTCKVEMKTIFIEPRPTIGQMAIFHCPRCGTIKKMYREMPDETETITPTNSQANQPTREPTNG